MFQITGFQANAFQHGGIASIRQDQNSGGWRRRSGRIRRWYDEVPTAEQIQEERERLGILPPRAQSVVNIVVSRESAAQTAEQASLLTAAYLNQVQQRRLMDRLRSESSAKRIKFRDEMFSIAQALIMDALMKRADMRLLDILIAEKAAEEAEISEVAQIWMQL